jgi:hypothetical protein
LKNDADSSTRPTETARPWGKPSPDAPRHAAANRRRWLSVIFFVLVVALVGGRAYRDLSNPQAWAYWKDLYFSPSMTSSVVRSDDPRLAGHSNALAIRGAIGPAAAGWFRDKLDAAKLVSGDMIVLSSPGGDLDQAIIIGEIIRSRGLATAVGVFDNEGRLRPSFCASACVFTYAGGTPRLGVEGSMLGVHRFTTETAGRADLVADTQRLSGIMLGYMSRMGVSPSVIEAMSATKEIQWLSAKEAVEMRLITDPLGKWQSARTE